MARGGGDEEHELQACGDGIPARYSAEIYNGSSLRNLHVCRQSFRCFIATPRREYKHNIHVTDGGASVRQPMNDPWYPSKA